jgi:hypothetical protein
VFVSLLPHGAPDPAPGARRSLLIIYAAAAAICLGGVVLFASAPL